MNTIIIYQSKYGFSKTYAQWLAQELEADLMQGVNVKIKDLKNYDTIVFGGGLYAGGMSGIAVLTKNFEQIKDKSLYLFTVGVADVSDEENIASIRSNLQQKLSPEMQAKIGIYHLRGGMKYSKMSFVHRTMMKMMMKMVRKKPESELRAEDKMMLETYGQDVDFTNRASIMPMVEDIKADVKPKLSSI